MVKLEAIIRPECFEALRHDLEEAGHSGLTMTPVRGAGREPRPVDWFRGLECRVRFLEKVKVELVLPDAMAEEAIWIIRNACYTGEVGDGRIFVFRIKDAIRVRTRERGYAAL